MSWSVIQATTDRRGYREREIGEPFPTFEAATAWLQRSVKAYDRDGYSVRRVEGGR